MNIDLQENRNRDGSKLKQRLGICNMNLNSLHHGKARHIVKDDIHVVKISLIGLDLKKCSESSKK